MIATPWSRPPGASTSASSRPTAPTDPGLGKYLMQRLIDSLRQAVPDGLECVVFLGLGEFFFP